MARAEAMVEVKETITVTVSGTREQWEQIRNLIYYHVAGPGEYSGRAILDALDSALEEIDVDKHREFGEIDDDYVRFTNIQE